MKEGARKLWAGFEKSRKLKWHKKGRDGSALLSLKV